ncbi:WXG100 family type VII secretion target [Micromonospora sp. BQ11]|uniref:WXG100 family type VII secretion target n=1 Tax=Micromonospora sp. BQ11 TaxID=3452212 RepID=UPI003F88A5AC
MSGKSWEDMAREVLVQGRPADIGSAALGWQELIRNVGQVQESLEQNVKDLGAAWKGPAYEAFKEKIEALARDAGTLVDAVERPGSDRRSIVTVLEAAARNLEDAQVAMPVPASCVGDVLAARNGETTLDTGLFEMSLKADWMGSWPVEQIGKFGDWLTEFVFDNTEKAREAYETVDGQFQQRDMEAPQGATVISGVDTPEIPNLAGGPGAGSVGGVPGLGGGAPSTGGIGGGVPSVGAGGLPGTGTGSGGGLGSGVHPDLTPGGLGTGTGTTPGTGSLAGVGPGTGASLAEDYGSGLAGVGTGTAPGLGSGFGGGGVPGTTGLGGGASGAGLAGAGGGMIPGGGALGRAVSPTLPPMMGGGAAGAGRGGGGRGAGGRLGAAGKLGAGAGMMPAMGGMAGGGAAGRGAGRAGGVGAGAAGVRGGGAAGTGARGAGAGAGAAGVGAAGAGARGAGAGGAGARGAGGVAGMGPVGGAGYREEEAPRNTWLEEDEDVWGADGDAAPGVLR